MRYTLKQIHCRPWTLANLSVPLMESHYENNYGGAMRRLNAITEKLESLDLAKTPGYVLASLKREELVALNSTLLHELYFASLGGDGTRPTPAIKEAIGARLRLLRSLARRVPRHGLRAGRRLGLGAAHLRAPRTDGS
jgi:Fe-Mn family superoxide dismutase